MISDEAYEISEVSDPSGVNVLFLSSFVPPLQDGLNFSCQYIRQCKGAKVS